MKKLILTTIAIYAFLGCFGQRYEIWAKPSQRNITIRGNYGFSNDSLLVIYTIPPWFFIPSRNIHIDWDDVAHLRIRNGSMNQTGMYIGMAVGGLVSYMRYNSAKKSAIEDFGILFELPLYPLLGIAAGYLVTSKKTPLQMYGMSPAEKNQLLKSKMKKKVN
jgi:hypothetical protein